MQIYWNAKKMFALEKSSTPTGLVWGTNITTVSLFWDTNMAAVTSCENPLLRVILFSLFGMSQLQECITGLEVDHNLTICLLIQRKNVLKPCRGMQCYLFPEAAMRNNIKQQIQLSDSRTFSSSFQKRALLFQTILLQLLYTILLPLHAILNETPDLSCDVLLLVFLFFETR